ncbi:MAG: DNA ligase [Pseudorhodoplanes sp.]|nr:DNA ligase [Pseudorhodoplanes sp.]
MSKLNRYRRKRDFRRTPEPRGGGERPITQLRFSIQKHAASHLHYDLRLEMDGVLKSWAIPKRPSLSPSERRLAIRTEDHPLSYRNFHGRIPKGEYGAGLVTVWDRGTYRGQHGGSEQDLLRGLRKGSLSFVLRGRKLRGDYALVRFKPPNQWLLIKTRDRRASTHEPPKSSRRARRSVK